MQRSKRSLLDVVRVFGDLRIAAELGHNDAVLFVFASEKVAILQARNFSLVLNACF